MVKAKEKTQTYEALYETLQLHLEKLESGQLTLDESLKVYQEAMKIADLCQQQLESAQAKIQLLEQSGEK